MYSSSLIFHSLRDKINGILNTLILPGGFIQCKLPVLNNYPKEQLNSSVDFKIRRND